MLISHADLDHCGGDRRMRELYPGALFACHELDRHWIEANAAMLARTTSGTSRTGCRSRTRRTCSASSAATRRSMSGCAAERRSDWARGAASKSCTFPATPWATSGSGIRAYRHTIRRIRSLEQALLLTAHYEPLGAEGARAFCDRSLAHVDAVEAIVRDEAAARTVDLREPTERVDERLGQLPEFATESAVAIGRGAGEALALAADRRLLVVALVVPVGADAKQIEHHDRPAAIAGASSSSLRAPRRRDSSASRDGRTATHL